MRTARRRRRSLVSALVLAAAVFASGAAYAGGADPTAATPQQKEEAQAHFTKAHDFFVQKQFPQALGEAKASWGIVASPNARLFIARCLREMGKLPEAYVEFSGTIDDANALKAKEARYADTAKAATDERGVIESQIGLLTVTVEHPTDDTQLTVAGALVDKSAWAKAQPVAPGNVDVAVQAGGKEVGKQSITVAPGEKKTVDIDANPPPPKPVVANTSTEENDMPDLSHKPAKVDVVPTAPSGRESLRTYAYIAGGVGVVGFALFGIFGAMEKSTFTDLQSSCPNNVCPPGKSDSISSGKTDQLVANIGLGVGIAGVAAGVTLFAISLGGKTHNKAPKSGATSLVVSPSFIGLRGAL
jgi:hypothetical protein